MSVQVEIVAKSTRKDGYTYVQFTADNGDSVGFIDTISTAQACFVFENILMCEVESSYAAMLEYIANTEYEQIEIGKVFDETDD